MRRLLLPYAFILPSFAFLASFLYYPVLLAFLHSFTEWNLVQTKWIGLDNFHSMLSNRMFRQGMRNQIIYTVSDVLKAIVIPLLAAEFIHMLRGNRSKYVYRTGFILPMLLPGIVTILLWQNMYDPTSGLINQLFRAIGLDSWATPWLGGKRSAIGALVMMGFPFIAGLPFLIFYAAIGSFNREQLEAARIDGASGWQVFRRLHLPMLKPQFRVVMILTIIGSLQDFVKIVVMTSGGPGDATVNPAFVMYNAAFGASQYGYGSAIGTALCLVIILLTIVNLRVLRSDD